MLKDIQIKIVLIFLVIGAIIISTMGYINYIGVHKVIENMPSNSAEYISNLAEYQDNIKVMTLCTIFIFSFICVIVRNFYDQKSNFSNYKAYR